MKKLFLFSILFITLTLVNFGWAIDSTKYPKHTNLFNGTGCSSNELFQSSFKPQVAAIAPDVRRIIKYVLSDGQAGKTYNSLATFVDRFGPRFTGTKTLEEAIDYMLGRLVKEGHENVHGEEVPVPVWVSFILFGSFSNILLFSDPGNRMGRNDCPKTQTLTNPRPRLQHWYFRLPKSNSGSTRPGST